MTSYFTRSTFNVVYAGLAFFVLFSAYNTLQNYATSLFPSGLADESLGVLYGVCAVSVFTVPSLIKKIGPRAALPLGALCYAIYLGGLCFINIRWLVLCLSAVIGWGSAVLWIAVGFYISENSDSHTSGTHNGLFWSIFQMNNIVGNLATWLVFPHLSGTTSLYLGFAVIAAVGTGMLTMLRPPSVQQAVTSNPVSTTSPGECASVPLTSSAEDDACTPLLALEVQTHAAALHCPAAAASINSTASLSSREDNFITFAEARGSDSASNAVRLASPLEKAAFAPEPEAAALHSPAAAQQRGIVADAIAAAKLLLDARMLCLVPLFFFSGLELSFWTGEFTQLLPQGAIGLVLLWAGVGETVGGYTLGRLGDRAGRTVSVTIGALLYGVGMGIACLLRVAGGSSTTPGSTTWIGPFVSGAPAVAFLAAFCFGCGDACFNANLYAKCGELQSGGQGGEGSNGGLRGKSTVAGGEEGEGALLSGPGTTGAGRCSADVSFSAASAATSTAAAGSQQKPQDVPLDESTRVGNYTIFQLLQNVGSAVWYLVALRLPLHDTPGSSTGSVVGSSDVSSAALRGPAAGFVSGFHHVSSIFVSWLPSHSNQPQNQQGDAPSSPLGTVVTGTVEGGAVQGQQGTYAQIYIQAALLLLSVVAFAAVDRNWVGKRGFRCSGTGSRRASS